MPRTHLLLYADAAYREPRAALAEQARRMGAFDELLLIDHEDVLDSEFGRLHEDILREPRGCGYWLWKPYVLYERLVLLGEGDVLLYMDSGDWLADDEPGLREHLILATENYRSVVLTQGAYPQGDWTKRDCFVLMGCEGPRYHQAVQVEAGVSIWKNTLRAFEILREWLNYCTDRRILTDDPNTQGLDNLPGFRDHRHDQSVLTNLQVRHRLTTSNDIRRWVHCNQNPVRAKTCSR